MDIDHQISMHAILRFIVEKSYNCSHGFFSGEPPEFVVEAGELMDFIHQQTDVPKYELGRILDHIRESLPQSEEA